jgi:hypothetical protein
MLETQIEIAAPPSKVREIVRSYQLHSYPPRTGTPLTPTSFMFHNKKLLDFSKYPEWHTSSFIKLLEPEDSSCQSLHSLQPGNKIKCDIDGMKFTAEIKVCMHHPITQSTRVFFFFFFFLGS